MTIPVDPAHDVGGQGSAGVLTDVLTLGANLGEFLRERQCDGWIDGPGQVDERFAAAEFLEHCRVIRCIVQFGRNVPGDLP